MGEDETWMAKEAMTLRRVIQAGDPEELAYFFGRYETIYENLVQRVPTEHKMTRREQSLAKAARVATILDFLRACNESIQEKMTERRAQTVGPYA